MAIDGQQNLSDSGELIIPNKISLKAVQLLEKAIGKSRITYLVESTLMPSKEIAKYIDSRKADGIIFRAGHDSPSELRRTIADKITAGRKVVYLPGKPLKLTGIISDIPRPIMRSLESLHIAPIPLFVGYYTKDVMYSVAEDDSKGDTEIRLLSKLPTGPDMASRILQAWMECSVDVFRNLQQFTKGSLAALMVHSMKKYWNNEVIDGMTDTAQNYGKIFAAALALSKKLATLTSARRVGIILPPGGGSIVANMACLLCHKVPVNFNYTVSEQSFKSSKLQSGAEIFLTADKFVRKLQQFPWPAHKEMMFIDQELPKMMGSIKKWFIYAKLMPADLIIKHLKLNDSGGEDEAVLLFTSGSSGEPKGVPLTHANVICNVAQCSSKLALSAGSRLLGALPVFHCFGLTVGVWYAIARGCDIVSYPTPLESKRLGELIYQYSVRLAVSTPTFLRGYIRHCPPDTFRSVSYMITGAEKLPRDLAEQFEEKFGVQPTEGYGLTEATPVISVNLNNLERSAEHPWVIPSNKVGSVGAIMHGVAVRITCPYTGAELPITKSGMVWFKGGNVFHGYLGGPALSANANLFKDGWMRTGDIGHCDEDGFLYIDGRLSRFSKVAGEMIPHEAVENAVACSLGLDPLADEKQLAIVGIPDPQKGESMALLSTTISDYLPQALTSLRYKLIEHGFPPIWCPREIVPVEAIPMLGTGKIDLMQCKRLAFEALNIEE